MPVSLFIVIILAIGFDFLNGVSDSSNIVATMITTRAIPPRVALVMTAIAEFSGPFIFGVAVATTIGDEIISSQYLIKFPFRVKIFLLSYLCSSLLKICAICGIICVKN